jgi:ATP-binding cassette subfamily F protein uup
MELDGAADFENLSAGLKRRTLLARGLVNEPDMLLLDEPTNHLDIRSIGWLENFLLRWGGTLLFVTHDRAFLQRLSTRIIELDRGNLYDWACGYDQFLKRRDAALSAEETANALFDKKLAREEAWIRRGIEARRTRNEGRVKALLALRETRQERREQPGKLKLSLPDLRRSGKIVAEADRITFGFDGKAVVTDFSTTIQRGDRIGIIGPNGCGKTTLLRLLSGNLSPQAGSIEFGAGMEVAYFDQLREQLDESKSVLDNVGEGRDTVTINGRTRSLIAYLEDFLFPSEMINAPISRLSGGERNRLLLARLFTRPANFLALDEPTNDLDLETVELLEDLLLEYSGTLVLVSHDRVFLNNLVTSTLVLDGSGKVVEVVGGYDDAVRQTAGENENADTAKKGGRPGRKEMKPAAPVGMASPRKKSYHEQQLAEQERKEWENLPARIEALEAEQEDLARSMADGAFYRQEPAAIADAARRQAEIHAEIAGAYHRWEELELQFGDKLGEND